MRPDEIKKALREWGHAVANRYAVSRGDRTVHVLQKVRSEAPGTAENAMRDLVGRDGRERRRFMAERSGVKGLRIVPTFAVDPVTASNDADRPHENPEIPVDLGIPDHLRWVDRLVAVMDREKPIMSACVRQEFCEIGSQGAKARRVNDDLEFGYEVVRGRRVPKFKKWMFRAEIERAVAWIEGFAAAA